MKPLQFEAQQLPPSLTDSNIERKRLKKSGALLQGTMGLSFGVVSIILFMGYTGTYISSALVILLILFLIGAIARHRVLKELLTALNDLNPESFPEYCINLDEWRNKDKIVQAYLKGIAEQGRPLVMGDYQAAEKWMDGAAERWLVQKARHACNQMAGSP